MRVKPLIAVFTVILGLYIYGCSTDGKETGLSNVSYYESVPLSVDERSYITQFFAKEKVNALDSLTNIYSKRLAFNGAILVSENGKIIYEKYQGKDRIRSGNPIERNTRFQLASVSKQFTAMGIMLLYEKGELDYDDKVTKYIPELPYENITIRQLLTHTAGLPNYMWLVERYWNESLPPYNEEVICLLQKHNLPLYFKPGNRYNYSNTGYILLASIIERISGVFYDDFLTEHIFNPLGMANSFVYSTSFEKTYPEKIEGFRTGRRGRYYQIPDDLHDGAVGDKGIYSTTFDLFLWEQGLQNELLISNSSIQNAFQPAVLNNGRTYNYGFGWRIVDNNGPFLTYHNGLWQGFRTSLRRYVNDGKTIIVLTNNNYFYINSLADDIRDILYKPSKPNATELIVDVLANNDIYEAADRYNKLKEIHGDNMEFGREQLIVLAGLFMDLENPVMVEKVFRLSDYLYNSDPDDGGLVTRD